MKLVVLTCLTWAWALPAALTAAEDDLARARRLLLTGKYAEAAEIYEPLAGRRPAAALGLARSLAARGEYDEAAQALTSCGGEHADLQAELGRLAFDRGDYEAAKTHVAEALRLDADQLLARWIGGELSRTSGKLKEAQEAYRGLIRFYNEHQKEITAAESLRWIGLAAARYARWNRLADQFHFLVRELYPDALKLDPDYWPAHYEAGLLFLEKYNQADAAAELKAALELNANAAEVHVALAQLALRDREVDKAQSSLQRALEINPRLLSARMLEADLAWANFRPVEAMRVLQQHAVPLNPASEEALGRLAACYVVLDGPGEEGGQTRLGKLVDEVTGRNKHAGEFFFALGGWLADRHKHAQAEQFYREAIRRMPQLIGPKAQLGMMFMLTGAEDKARGWLEAAFEEDPFNVRVDNVLKLLDVLEVMETRRTKHCLLKFDPQRDRLLARYAAEHLDEVHAELCRRFGYWPAEPPLVEIFNEAGGVSGHQWFGTRMIGLPYVGTVAATTGKMVGMVSPNEPSLGRKFNWASGLKHEMVHVITLQQTDFNIPHWYTEGLAVWSEGYPRPQAWNELLAARVPKGDVFNLQTINFGFSRAGSRGDTQLAYCQAELYVEYMLQDRSPEVLRKLLDAYADNLTTGEAIREVFGVSEEDFERGYAEYLKKVVAGLPGLGKSASESFADLLEAHRRKPDDPDLAARVAYGYLRRGAEAEAGRVAERALGASPGHQLASYVLARLHVQAGRVSQAVELLDACLDRHKPEPLALNLLAGLKLKAKAFDEAAELYQLGARRDPQNLQWVRALARVYLACGDDEKLAEALARLARADSDDLATRKKLAEIALAGQDFAAAADWANQALQIDVQDADVHRLFAEALVGRHNDLQAIEEFRIAVQLDPEDSRLRLALAKAHLRVGKPREARAILEKLLRLDPDHLDAAVLLEKLEEGAQP